MLMMGSRNGPIPGTALRDMQRVASHLIATLGLCGSDRDSSCHLLLSLTLRTLCMPVSFSMISKVKRLSSKLFELEHITSIS